MDAPTMSPFEKFKAELLRRAQSTEQLTADDLSSPNKYCWTEDNSKWYSLTVARPTLLVPVGTPGTIRYNPAQDGMGLSGQSSPEVYTGKSGVCFLFVPGTWNVQLPLVGSAAAVQCYVALDAGSRDAALLLNLLQGNALDDVNVKQWGGAALPAASIVTGSANENQLSPTVRAVVSAQDTSVAGNSQLITPGARASANKQLASLYRLLTDSLVRVYDVFQASYQVMGGLEEIVGGQISAGYMLEMRRSGYAASKNGRRFSVKSPNLTGVAAATGFVSTTPTFLLVNGSTNEAVIRRIKIGLPAVGTSTTFRLLVKIDSADRFSAGGTTRTPANMNGTSATAATQARSLETPTANAEGGGTRDIWCDEGQLVAGGEIIYEPEDGLIVAASGSLLIYVVTATAGATIDYNIEYEDVNVT